MGGAKHNTPCTTIFITTNDIHTKFNVMIWQSDREGKGMRPQVGEHCVKDTKEEEEGIIMYAYIVIEPKTNAL